VQLGVDADCPPARGTSLLLGTAGEGECYVCRALLARVAVTYAFVPCACPGVWSAHAVCLWVDVGSALVISRGQPLHIGGVVRCDVGTADPARCAVVWPCNGVRMTVCWRTAACGYLLHRSAHCSQEGCRHLCCVLLDSGLLNPPAATFGGLSIALATSGFLQARQLWGVALTPAPVSPNLFTQADQQQWVLRHSQLVRCWCDPVVGLTAACCSLVCLVDATSLRPAWIRQPLMGAGDWGVQLHRSMPEPVGSH